MRQFFDGIYSFFTSKRQKILGIFRVVCWLLVVFLIIAFVLSRFNQTTLFFLFGLGNTFGTFSLLAYVTTLLPGIGDRLGVKNKILVLLKIYRREVGISMYFLALIHVTLEKLLIITSVKELLTLLPFEIMGTLAILICFFLFITSNTVSMVWLKLNWYRIHRLTYIGMFFIFLHVALVKLSIWTLLMGFVLMLQLISLIVIYRRTDSFTGGGPI